MHGNGRGQPRGVVGTGGTVLLLVVLMALTAVSVGQATRAEGPFHFAWAAPGAPAIFELPIPDAIEPSRLVAVELPDTLILAGFAVDVEQRSLILHLAPKGDKSVTFSTFSVLLSDGTHRTVRLGSATVVPAAGLSGVLEFQRSLSIPSAGLLQAVAVENVSDENVVLSTLEFGAAARNARLLVASGRDAPLLMERLEEALAGFRGSPVPQWQEIPEGFHWLPAGEAAVVLQAGESALIAWVLAGLPQAREAAIYLRPVIGYASVSRPQEVGTLGLPVVVRWQP